MTLVRRFVTNIVFTNGLLDPWSAFGVLTRDESYDDSIVVIKIPDGGHHGAAELRGAHPSAMKAAALTARNRMNAAAAVPVC
jgi:hypothetical protein